MEGKPAIYDNTILLIQCILFLFSLYLQTIEEGKSYLISARDNYQSYDFENRLTVRIHSALRLYSTAPRVSRPNHRHPHMPSQTASSASRITSQQQQQETPPMSLALNPHADSV